MITFKTFESYKGNTVEIWNKVVDIKTSIERVLADLDIKYPWGDKFIFVGDNLVCKLTHMNLGQSSDQVFKVNIDWLKETVIVHHLNELSYNTEEVTISFDDLDTAPVVLYKNYHNKLSMIKDIVKEMEIAY